MATEHVSRLRESANIYVVSEPTGCEEYMCQIRSRYERVVVTEQV